MSTWSGRVLAACLLLGCGPKSEAKAPKPVTVDAPLTTIVEEPPDLSPVKRPAEVVLVGHIARPRLFFETLAKWGSLPVRLEDVLPAPVRGLGRAVLWEAPVDALVALDPFGEGKVPPPLLVASVGLKSLEEGLKAAEAMQLQTRQLAPGVYRIGEFADTSCAMAASVGSSPARLVCGPGAKDVDQLLPYAIRGLPLEPQTGADFELTLDTAPIQQRYGQEVAAARLLGGLAMREVALDSARFDRALSDTIYGSIDEAINLFNDLDQLRLEARLDASRNVLTGSAELRLKGESSWVAGTIAASKPTDVPATLPRLPPSTTAAWYSAEQPAARYTPITRVVADLAEGFLEHEKLPEGTRKRLRHLVEPWFSKLPENFGFVLSPSQLSHDSSSYRYVDTTVTRISEPPARVLGIYADMMGILADPALKRWVKEKTKFDPKAWPKASKKSVNLPGFKTPGTAFELVVDVKAVAAQGSSAAKIVEDLVPPGDPSQLARMLLVVQPDGPFTYVISGQDLPEITRAMTELKKNAPGAFFAKPARVQKVMMAGFVTLAYIGRVAERSAKQPEVGKAIAATPHHGETPIPFSATTAPGMARFDIEIPAAVFSDGSAAAMHASGALKSSFDRH